MTERLMVIDGHSLMNRAYFAMGNAQLTTPDGVPSGALFNFFNMLQGYLAEYKPTHLLVCFDRSEPTFRHEFYDDYKAGRRPMDDELRVQFPMLRESLKDADIAQLDYPGYEADDLIGMVSKLADAEHEVYILSGDRDTIQLVNPHVTQIMPQNRGQTTVYTPESVVEIHGIRADQIVELKALMGDSSDNIPGVPGIGVKTATKFLQKYGDLKTLYEHLDELTPSQRKTLTENKEKLLLSEKLARIETDGPVPMKWDDFVFHGFGGAAGARLYKRFESYGFRRLIERFGLSDAAQDADAGASEDEKAPETHWSDCFDIEIHYGEAGLVSLDEALSDVSQIPEDKRLAYWPLDPSTAGDILDSIGAQAATDAASAPDAPDTPVTLDAPDEGSVADAEAPSGESRDANQQTLYAIAFEDALSQSVLVGAGASEREPRIYDLYLVSETELRVVLEIALERGWILLSNHTKEHFKKLDFYPLDQVFDLEIACHILGLTGRERTLDAYFETFLQDDLPTIDMMDMLQGKGTGQTLDGKEGLFFEGQVMHRLADQMAKRVAQNGAEHLCYEIEMPLIAVLAKMENEGVLIDEEALELQAEDLSMQIEELEDAIREEAGHDFNPNSPKQLADLLFEQRGLPPGRKTSSGGYSTDADELERLSELDPLVGLILDYRKLTKFLSTTIDGLLQAIGDDGRVHSQFHQAIAQTGRLSSSDPNLQNIPVREELGRQIRRVFVADEGNVLLDADYSQIELRLLASLSGDAAMLEAYREKADIHRRTAASIFGIDEADVTPELRSHGKTINFSIIYGISAFGLARDLKVSRADAQAYIDRYYERYPGVRVFMDSMIDQAKEKGYVETLFGRRRYIPELKSKNYARRQFGERVAMNTPIQGTAADIIKYAMVRTERSLRREGTDARLILQIHDELILEAPESESDQVANLLKEAMEGASELPVPLEADVLRGPNWLEVK